MTEFTTKRPTPALKSNIFVIPILWADDYEDISGPWAFSSRIYDWQMRLKDPNFGEIQSVSGPHHRNCGRAVRSFPCLMIYWTRYNWTTKFPQINWLTPLTSFYYYGLKSRHTKSSSLENLSGGYWEAGTSAISYTNPHAINCCLLYSAGDAIHFHKWPIKFSGKQWP